MDRRITLYFRGNEAIPTQATERFTTAGEPVAFVETRTTSRRYWLKQYDDANGVFGKGKRILGEWKWTPETDRENAFR